MVIENALIIIKTDIQMILSLQKTRIGMAVNVLRKSSSNAEVQTISKGLIKSWKKLLTGNKLLEYKIQYNLIYGAPQKNVTHFHSL